MFFGFSTKEEALSQFPDAKIVQRKKITVCNNHSRCLGSIKGVFFYEDGTEDAGRVVIKVSASDRNHQIAWTEDQLENKIS